MATSSPMRPEDEKRELQELNGRLKNYGACAMRVGVRVASLRPCRR